MWTVSEDFTLFFKSVGVKIQLLIVKWFNTDFPLAVSENAHHGIFFYQMLHTNA